MKIAFYGSSLLSSYWNGAATYYRGLLRELAQRGYKIVFYEPDAFERQKHRDIVPPDWAEVVVYPAEESAALRVAAEAAAADIVVKASGVGVFDELLLQRVMASAAPHAVKIYWDVDAPATLAELGADSGHPLRRSLPHIDCVLTYGGGPPVVEAYRHYGARFCKPIYNALDPQSHHPVPRSERFAADLNFLANRLPDRERRVQDFFIEAALALPSRRFLLGGSGWDDKDMPSNVRRLGHVGSADHNAFNASPRAVLNVARDSMAEVGYSPATRVFEAAGTASCLITDSWTGIELFLKPDAEILVARDGREVAEHLSALTAERAREIGAAALRRVLAEHTYAIRAAETDTVLKRVFGTKKKERRMTAAMRLIVFGLSISSSWGNGHATTYRALLKAFAARGHHILFLERDTPWYSDSRDFTPDFCALHFYRRFDELQRYADAVRDADAVMIGSFVPEGAEIGRWLCQNARGVTAFYDIDTPVTLAKLERNEIDYIDRSLVSEFDLYFSFSGGRSLTRLAEEYGAPAPRPLFCSVDPGVYRPRRVPLRWDLSYLGTYSSDRQPMLDRLLLEAARQRPDWRFCVAGAQYPKETRWPDNVERIEHVPPDRHAEFYSASRFSLNLTRAHMVAAGHSPSVRLFEAAACGSPIISDDWPGLSDFLVPGKEIVLAQRADDVLRALSEPNRFRAALSNGARRRILAEHTARHRAEEFETHLRWAVTRKATEKTGLRPPAMRNAPPDLVKLS